MYMKPCQTFLTFLVNSSSLNVVVFLLEAKTSVGVKQVNMLQSFVCQHAALRYFSWRFSEARLDLGKYVCRDRSLPAFIVKRLKIPKRKIVPLALT